MSKICSIFRSGQEIAFASLRTGGPPPGVLVGVHVGHDEIARALLREGMAVNVPKHHPVHSETKPQDEHAMLVNQSEMIQEHSRHEYEHTATYAFDNYLDCTSMIQKFDLPAVALVILQCDTHVHGADVTACANQGSLPVGDLAQCDVMPHTATLSDSTKCGDPSCGFTYGDDGAVQTCAHGQASTASSSKLRSCSALQICRASGSAVNHRPKSVVKYDENHCCAWRLHVEECRHAKWIKVFVWHTSTGRDMHVTDCSECTVMWLHPEALVKDLKNQITDSLGLIDADLYMASTEVVEQKIDAEGPQDHNTQAIEASEGTTRMHATSGVMWGRLKMILMTWDDNIPLKTGAHVCSGAHVLSLSRNNQFLPSRSIGSLGHECCGPIYIAASETMHVAATGSPVSFLVSVNHPRTQDFSIDVVAHPWTTLGDTTCLLSRVHVYVFPCVLNVRTKSPGCCLE